MDTSMRLTFTEKIALGLSQRQLYVMDIGK